LNGNLLEEVYMSWSQDEKKNLPPIYGCQLIYDKATLEQIKDTNVPNDAYLVTYIVDGEVCVDVCRGRKVKIFDLYYDKFGTGSMVSIDFGYGKVNPKLWGYTPSKKDKKK
jgi:hypothetical protein